MKSPIASLPCNTVLHDMRHCNVLYLPLVHQPTDELCQHHVGPDGIYRAKRVGTIAVNFANSTLKQPYVHPTHEHDIKLDGITC